MIEHASTIKTESGYTMDILTLWKVIVEGFKGIWPKRTQLDGENMGDVWFCKALKLSQEEVIASGSTLLVEERCYGLQPLHKLTLWLTYSLVEIFERVLNVKLVSKFIKKCMIKWIDFVKWTK